MKSIEKICKNWTHKMVCTKQELQSLLGTLLYITKCVKPARYFLNRMLQPLRDSYNQENIFLIWILLQILIGLTHFCVISMG